MIWVKSTTITTKHIKVEPWAWSLKYPVFPLTSNPWTSICTMFDHSHLRVPSLFSCLKLWGAWVFFPVTSSLRLWGAVYWNFYSFSAIPCKWYMFFFFISNRWSFTTACYLRLWGAFQHIIICYLSYITIWFLILWGALYQIVRFHDHRLPQTWGVTSSTIILKYSRIDPGHVNSEWPAMHPLNPSHLAPKNNVANKTGKFTFSDVVLYSIIFNETAVAFSIIKFVLKTITYLGHIGDGCN